MVKCPTCEGHGKLIAQLSSWQKDYLPYGEIQRLSKPIDCPKCRGSGKI